MFKRGLICVAFAAAGMMCGGMDKHGERIENEIDVRPATFQHFSAVSYSDNTLRVDGAPIDNDLADHFFSMLEYEPTNVKFHGCKLVGDYSFGQLLVGRHFTSISITGCNLSIHDLRCVVGLDGLRHVNFSNNKLSEHFMLVDEFLSRKIPGVFYFDTFDLSDNGFSKKEKEAIRSHLTEHSFSCVGTLTL